MFVFGPHEISDDFRPKIFSAFSLLLGTLAMGAPTDPLQTRADLAMICETTVTRRIDVDTSPSTIGTITRHLLDWRGGDAVALSRLTDEIYGELRRLAGAVLGSRAGFRAFQPTELVHELYFRLPALQTIDWQGRAHFLNLSAKVMRSILIDYARKLQASKRGGTPLTLPFNASSTDPAHDVDVLLVHDALDRFAADYPRQAHVLELRFFGGLTTGETSDVLRASGHEASIRTVERDWTFAKAWMQDVIATR